MGGGGWRWGGGGEKAGMGGKVCGGEARRVMGEGVAGLGLGKLRGKGVEEGGRNDGSRVRMVDIVGLVVWSGDKGQMERAATVGSFGLWSPWVRSDRPQPQDACWQ
ncbi:DUF4311 domain-containing protein [Salmonella enterica]|uniref:DUF4311 domain-containing protein n=1 Tax=Salmonella enterica TaxID=28901 RepID=UPI00398C2767